jgi:hypothetical protein
MIKKYVKNKCAHRLRRTDEKEKCYYKKKIQTHIFFCNAHKFILLNLKIYISRKNYLRMTCSSSWLRTNSVLSLLSQSSEETQIEQEMPFKKKSQPVFDSKKHEAKNDSQDFIPRANGLILKATEKRLKCIDDEKFEQANHYQSLIEDLKKNLFSTEDLKLYRENFDKDTKSNKKTDDCIIIDDFDQVIVPFTPVKTPNNVRDDGERGYSDSCTNNYAQVEKRSVQFSSNQAQMKYPYPVFHVMTFQEFCSTQIDSKCKILHKSLHLNCNRSNKTSCKTIENHFHYVLSINTNNKNLRHCIWYFLHKKMNFDYIKYLIVKKEYVNALIRNLSE